MTNDNLEEEERKKYNHFVSNHSYGSDKHRESATRRVCNDLGAVSKLYVDILEGFKDKDIKSKVLDIGSGPGGVMAWLQDFSNVEAYGVDISDEFVKTLRANFPHLTNTHVCNANDLSIFEDDTFELVQHLDGLEHIPVEWELDCLKEAVRVSKKYIVYEIATEDALADSWAKDGSYTYDAAHINLKKPEEWYSFFKDHSSKLGFNVVESFEGNNPCAFILEKVKK